MTDYLWRQGDRTIARYVSADKIPELNTIARLTNDEVCGYEEDGVYVGTYSSMNPNLKPKLGIVSKLLRKKTPQRDHLFVNIGPHKLIMKINSKWESREEANILAIITATTPADHIHKLFPIARGIGTGPNDLRPEGIVTASDLISWVHGDISAKFNSYVLKLNNPSEMETKEDFLRIEHELQQIAEDEFSKIGVIVQSTAINYGDSGNDKLIDLQAEADGRMQTGIAKRRIKSEMNYSSSATKMDSLTNSIENKAMIRAEANSEGVERDYSRTLNEETARELSRRSKEREAESINNTKLRDEARKIHLSKAILQAATEMKSMANQANEVGVESDEE